MKNFLILFFSFISSFLSAQEVLTNLISNPHLLDNRFISNLNKSVLGLPFIDDFSNDGSIVNADLWEQSSVFVNRTYALNPPTIGVATFDGMNEKGLARNLTPFSSSEPSDTLLSKEIDLSGLNTAYLMFYFQGKGIGDAPQLEDKLVLEFLKDSVWVEQWSSNGQTMQQFEKEIVIIDSAHYLITDFKFRFRRKM